MIKLQILSFVYRCSWRLLPSCFIQLSPEEEVSSDGYVTRREASRYISTALHRPWGGGIVVLVFTKSDWWKNAVSFNGQNLLVWNVCVTTRHFSLRSQNRGYPRIFRVTGANQNAQKLLPTDLVNTNNNYFKFILPVFFLFYTPIVWWKPPVNATQKGVRSP